MDKPLRHALAAQASSRRYHMSRQDLAITALSFARLEVVDLPLMDAIAAAAIAKSNAMGP